ncbi:hypothetical protein OIU76_002458 [Salix suchowensis]|nr:hypothetical protein OIU76_002458 [Salix suchowensis]
MYPADGKTIGEIMFRGNTVMSGYLKDLKATEDAFSGGWFRSGDLAVKHSDGYIELKDRKWAIIPARAKTTIKESRSISLLYRIATRIDEVCD